MNEPRPGRVRRLLADGSPNALTPVTRDDGKDEPSAVDTYPLHRISSSRGAAMMTTTPRLIPILGVIISILVGIAVLTGWPSDSTVASSPAARVGGALVWARIFGLAQAVAFLLFLATLTLVRRRPPRTAVVLSIAAVIQLLPLAGPMILSGDGWSYWSVGRIAAVLGGNPYVDVAASYPLDVSTAYVFDTWRDLVTPYGPVWVGASSVAALVGGTDPNVTTWLFRAGAGAAMVALAVMVSRSSPRPAFAAVFIGWNPVFAMQYAGSGHNDAIMAALVVGGLIAASAGRHRLGGLSWAIGIGVKWLPLVLVPLQATDELARKGRSLITWMLVSLISLGFVFTFVFGTSWVNAIAPVAENATTGIRSLAIWPRLEGHLPSGLLRFGPILLFGVAYLFLIWQAWRGRTRRGLAAGLFLVASPLLWPWYLIAPAALSAYEDDATAMSVTLAMVIYAGLLYLGDAGSVLDVYFPA